MPGAIQPHGRLAVLRDDGRLVAYSENWESPGQVQAALAGLPLHDTHLAAGESPAALGTSAIDEQPWDAIAHRSGQHLVVEFEPATPDTGLRAPIYSLARHFLPQLQAAESVVQLAQLAATEIKRLTGFGRSLVYRFDGNGHGEVLAEAIDPGYDSYQGHRFPAADIPAQARELYRLNHIRLIPDANYQPVGLRGLDAAWQPASLDLSLASLRSVSPIHLEYMRNMRTLASMSVSIVVGGQLWGLISCHDHEPRGLPFQTRVACEHLGRLLSMQVEAKEMNAEVATRLELRKLTLEIVSHLANSDATLKMLVNEPAPLLRLASAAGAAVVLDDDCWSVGEVPPREQIAQLAQWIGGLGQPVWHSDQLAQDVPGASAWADAPAGVVAVSISQVHRHVILWFRPELVRTIQWAGDPRKQVQASDGRIHPRRSFASWQEQERGRSAPWNAGELAAVAELRQALIGIVLRRAEEMAEVATELGRVNKELEAFSYTVSHDLRAPMRHIAGYVDLVMDTEGGQLSDRARRYLAHVKEASAFAGHLVDALLDFSRMGRSAIKRSPVNVQTLVEDLVHEFKRQEPGRAVDWQVDTGLPLLQADPFLLQVAVRNLLSNAVKYTRQRERARIQVKAVRRREGDGLEVRDNGVGFQMKYVGKLFGVFQRLHQAEDFEGTGIGLASVKRIVERHGGTVWAQGEVGEGASFGFVLPHGLNGAVPPKRKEDRNHA
ncbi:candidate histidine kinase, classic [Ramlibacter tataouinensis TTB310]|uniref:histidine kinase n=1 Tax=Ramlibacter tataouinensis (strain ATCC BAA-407 / DSM 14655 / LMG 21543 / TTB310) TaxID=365046 RepID=F5Y2U7_RAMTT|nr:candidate histidine kinase, classic [Ramlibacter tataouinensis TTB310]